MKVIEHRFGDAWECPAEGTLADETSYRASIFRMLPYYFCLVCSERVSIQER